MTTLTGLQASYWRSFTTPLRRSGHFVLVPTMTMAWLGEPQAQEPTDLLRHVGSSLAELRRSAVAGDIVAVDDAVEQKLTRLLAHCASPDAAFPSISATGTGGAHLYWRAGRETIEVILEDAAEFFVRITSVEGVVVFEQEGSGDLPAAEIGTALARLSKRLLEVNPEWRNLFSR